MTTEETAAADAGGDATGDTPDAQEAVRLQRLEARVGVLYRRFRQIAEGMKDLPLYNHAIAVEPVDFQLLPGTGSEAGAGDGGQGIGVLVTPWFMSVVLLPLEAQSFRMAEVGRRVTRSLPAGACEFVVGGDEVVGHLESLSLFSPLSDFATHEAAVLRGQAMLAALMTVPKQEGDEQCARTTVYRQRGVGESESDGAAGRSSRRDFLFGRER